MIEYKVKENYYGRKSEFKYFMGKHGELLIEELPADLASYYPDDYHCHSITDERRNIKERLKLRIKKAIIFNQEGNPLYYLSKNVTLSPQMQAFAQLKLPKTAKILEVGCGGGDFVRELNSLGFKNVKGIDPYLPESLDNSPLFERKFIFDMEEKFDCIYSNHSLEHMDNHNRVFEKLRKLVCDGGRILIRTPVSNSIALKEYGAS